MENPLTLSADFGLSFYIAVAIVVGVNGIKWIFVKLPWTWTNRIPDWGWMVWAWVFAVGACLLLKVDVLSKLFGSADFVLNVPWSYIASGFAIGISSNVLYSVVKPIAKKLKTPEGKIICLPPGVPLPTTETTTTTTEDRVTEPLVAPTDVPSVQPATEPAAVPAYIPKHAARDALYELVLVAADEPVFLTGPSDSAPTHVMIPANWRRDTA